MEVVLTNGKYQSFNTLYKETVLEETGGGLAVNDAQVNRHLRDHNPPSVVMYERPFTPYGTINNTTNPTNFQNYGSSFGPASETYMQESGAEEVSGSISYMPHTPPYYGGGIARCIIMYSQSANGNATIDEVLEQSEYIYQRQYDIFSAGGIGALSAMNLSSSINLTQVYKESLKPLYNENGEITGYEEGEPDSPVHRWVIQPKFETPVLDFSGVTYDTPLSGSGSIATGMWHQYGRIPAGNKGIYIHLKDVDVEDIFFGVGGLSTDLWDANNIRSLGTTCGFLKTKGNGQAQTSKKKKIGKLNDKKKIKEAVIAIPFRKIAKDKMHFYEIPREYIDYALTVKKGANPWSGNTDLLFDQVNQSTGEISMVNGESVPMVPDKTVIEMAKKMSNYVIPPHLDFITYSDMTPFVAYVFEFEHELSKLDLSDIWQNLSPRSLMSVKEPKESIATITHDLMLKDFFGLNNGKQKYTSTMETDTQWMVFKVKQKASRNYFDKTADSYDQFKFKKVTTPDGPMTANINKTKFLKEYSYNWPYDFFSMVELVKLQAEVSFTEGKETPKGTSYYKKSPAVEKTQDDATDAGPNKQKGPQGQGNNSWKP